MVKPSRPVRIPAEGVLLEADLVLPEPGRGIVLFAHGSGSGRKSPRNREVAERLHERGLGTLLLDLLASAEVPVDELTGEYRFDIDLLAGRLLAATDWLVQQPGCERLPLGYFGASTGGAVAMVGAAQRPEVVAAIVLRGARTDLGDRVAARIRCPTLVVVGGDDPLVVRLNQGTMQRLRCIHELTVIPAATHLFEEPGALDRVADLTTAWFERYLRSDR